MLGFYVLLLLGLGILVVTAVIQRRWSDAAEKEYEVLRLLATASEETAVAEFEATPVNVPRPSSLHCAVCYSPTARRCSQCKSVRYCSGKCQIAHWRQGHKDECHYLRTQFERSNCNEELGSLCDEETMQHDFASTSAGCDLVDSNSFQHVIGSDIQSELEKPASEEHNLLGPTTKMSEIGDSKAPVVGFASLETSVDRLSTANKSYSDEKVTTSLQFNKAKMAKHNTVLTDSNSSSKKLTKATPLAVKLTKDTAKSKSSSSNKDEDKSRVVKSKEVHTPSSLASKDHQSPNSVLDFPQNTRSGLKTSVRKVVQQFKASKQSKCDLSLRHGSEIMSKHKLVFPYEVFVKLYSHDMMLVAPFGLTNCGNSCYANAVFQCLAFTRPFASYLFQGLHAKSCRKEWCFICEFEYLIQKAKEGTSPLNPVRILSKLHKNASHLGHGKEEDAHEFLRYAVDTMQSVFLNNAGVSGPLAEESTLIGMTFGGYLLSKIKCMKCHGKSERCERMMDLTVEIDGEIRTLEEALSQFTATETLDRDNKYHCNRCKSYERAKKKLAILEAPNILTIVLKRFKSGNFEKLTKFVRFPEVLDISPYMSRTSDTRHSQYSLYAVVVHLDVTNATFSGHYVCYVKNVHGNWFKTDDTSVLPVQIERVLSEGAYILLYSRRSPRPPAMLGVADNNVKPKTWNFEAIPSKPNISGLDRYEWRSNSSSESSSIFSSSDASSSSTDDFSDFIFGEPRRSLYSGDVHHRKSTSVLDNVLWSDPPFGVRT